MKLFIALFVVALVASAQALTDEQKAKLEKHMSKCADESKVDQALVKKMRAGEFTDDAKLMAYVHCMFVQLHFINEKGELQLDTIKSKIPADVKKADSDKVIENCKGEKGATHIETAYKVYKCYRKSASKTIVI